MGYMGPKFTQMRSITSHNFKGACLDQALCSIEWLNQYANYEVLHGSIINSNNASIVIRVQDNASQVNNRSFKFQMTSTTHVDFLDMIKINQRSSNNLTENTSSINGAMTACNNEVFGNICKRKKRLEARFVGAQWELVIHRVKWLAYT